MSNFITLSSSTFSQLTSMTGENITTRFLQVNENATFLFANMFEANVTTINGINGTFAGEIGADSIRVNELTILTESPVGNAVVTNNRLESRLAEITKGPTGPIGPVGPPGQPFRIQTSVSSLTGLTGIFPGNHVLVNNNLYLYENGQYIFITSMGYTGSAGEVGPTGSVGRGLRFFAIGTATGDVTPLSSNIGEFALIGNDVYVCNQNLELQFVSTIGDTTALYGFEGPTGEKGPTGETGFTGWTGPTGAPGTSLRFFAVASSTGSISPTNENIGEFALIGNDVYVYRGNDEYSFVKNLENIPTIQGPTGVRGPTGTQGPTGPSGRGMKVFAVANTFETVRPTYENVGDFAVVNNELYVYTLTNSGTGQFTFLLPIDEAFRGLTGPTGTQGMTGPAGPAGTGSSGANKEISLWLESAPAEQTMYIGMNGGTSSTPGYRYQIPIDSGTYRIKSAYLYYS